jgi:hypothetical protein
MLHILLLASFIRSTCGSVYNYGSRVDGAIVHYEMPRDECISGSFTDSATDNLFGNLIRESTTSCNNGIGVKLIDYEVANTQAQVVSQYDATDFIAVMDNSANFTLEFWMDSSEGSGASTDRPIITIGTVDDSVNNDCLATGHSHITYGITVYDRASTGKIYFYYSAEVNGKNYCPWMHLLARPSLALIMCWLLTEEIQTMLLGT